ncbi:MAG: hypothetical protein II992_03290 [Lachnospiraceae bacterium]|nr:hypothetical protein [Lachnospiraceae bacterium]
MINGRSLKEELKRIDNFLDNLSSEEFEAMKKRIGFGIIKQAKESSYVLAMQEANKTKNKGYTFKVGIKEFNLNNDRAGAA